jgi:hypothetical protein
MAAGAIPRDEHHVGVIRFHYHMYDTVQMDIGV